MRNITLFLLTAAALTAQTPSAAVEYDAKLPQLRFAATEILSALAGKGAQADARFVLSVAAPSKTAVAQAYSIRKRAAGGKTTYTALGADAAGAMYGGLDLAEAVRMGTLGELRDSDHKPYIARRGFKFNIPLDVRTPSYTDSGDAAQQNIPEMWSSDFWREFLDEMARQRFNVLSLWNLHPFPSIVKVPEYPDIALEDVKRTTIKLDHNFSHSGGDMARPDMLKNMETVKKITIGEKIQFWRDVMQLARDRGIEVYIFTWNIFTFGTDGKYGITPSMNNPATIDYFRKSVRETVLTYPLLAGIGITAGEEMRDSKEAAVKEKWLWQTYGEGIRDAKKLQPNREFRLIHRFHQSALKPILEAWKDYPGKFDLSYKYSVAHMYSSPAPPFYKQDVPDLPKNLRVWMTVRNDDIYNFRWGDPTYAREYIRNLPGPDQLAGYYMGPDGYIWGREFVSTEPERPRDLVIKKQWYSFMLWGRLSYEPALPDALFERALAQRFPEVPAAKLFAAWNEASRIIPQITRFFWGDIDLKWFPEASLSSPKYRGYYTVKHFMEGETMPGTGILKISAYRDRLLAGQPLGDSITPLQVAAMLDGHAQSTLKVLAEFPSVRQKELRLTLGDLKAMAYLGQYYAEKIRGAADLSLFDRTANPEQQASAVKHLDAALGYWTKYAAVAGAQYKPQLLNRVGYVDLNALAVNVAQDVEMARRWQPKK